MCFVPRQMEIIRVEAHPSTCTTMTNQGTSHGGSEPDSEENVSAFDARHVEAGNPQSARGNRIPRTFK